MKKNNRQKMIWIIGIMMILLAAVIVVFMLCGSSGKTKSDAAIEDDNNHTADEDETTVEDDNNRTVYKDETDILIPEIVAANEHLTFYENLFYGYSFPDIAEEAHANAKYAFASYFNQLNDAELVEAMEEDGIKNTLPDVTKGKVFYLGNPVTMFTITKKCEVWGIGYCYPIISNGKIVQWVDVSESEKEHHVNPVYHAVYDLYPELTDLCSSMGIENGVCYIIFYGTDGEYVLTENETIKLSDMSAVTDCELAENRESIIESIRSAHPNCSYTSVKDIYDPENVHMAIRYYQGMKLPEKEDEEIPAETAYSLIEESFDNEGEDPVYPDDFCEMYVDYRENEVKCVIATVNVNDKKAIEYYKKIAEKYADTLEFIEGDMPLNYIYKEVIPEIVAFGTEHAEAHYIYGKQIECDYREDEKWLELDITAENADSLFELIKAEFENEIKYGVKIVPTVPAVVDEKWLDEYVE